VVDRVLLALGAAFGFLGVGLGAFGAHALKARLTPEMLGIFEIGVRYQMYHALALVAVGVVALSRPSALLTAAGYSLAAGILVFSGSLYILALTETRWLGAITPLGGLAFLIGWALFFWAMIKA
jgi:uncharacterized membrane protein YgdD (TMEM256/DUF423 family)